MTSTPTHTISVTPTPTPTSTFSQTLTATFTNSFTSSATWSFTSTATPTPTLTAVLEETSTPTSSFTPPPAGPTPGYSVAPNLSRGGQPIIFTVDLTAPSIITLDLYDLSGELVYTVSVQGQVGVNPITWNLENSNGESVASGLYLFYIHIAQGFPLKNPYGKVVVLR